MAKEPIVAPREKTEQPNINETKKDQKAHQLPEEYVARLVNQEFDRIHERINQIVVEYLDSGEVVEDLLSTATLAEVITRVNLQNEIMRNAGLLRRTK